MRRSLFWLVWLTLAFAASSAAQPARHVLILYSFDAEYATDVAFARALRADLSERSSEPLNFFEASVQPAPQRGAVQEGTVANYLRASLSEQRIDLVVTVSAPAAQFARRYRDELFPKTPLLLTSLDQRWLQNQVLTTNEVAVPVVIDPTRVVQDALRLLPRTTRLFVVVGYSPLERAWRDELTREFRSFQDRLTIDWFEGLSFAEILKGASALPPNSAILYLIMTLDAKGFSHSEPRVLSDLHKAANAPVFGIGSHQLGSGVVGGPVLSIDDMAANSAGIALRLLRGESGDTIKTVSLTADRPMYDWRALQRWGISEAQLPAGSSVLFRQPAVWDQYRLYILGATAIFGVQSAFIAGLVLQRARRHRVERALRESEHHLRESYEQNQDLAGRLINAQEAERSRIARDLHDDLSQQIAGLGIVLSGLKRKVGRPDLQAEVDHTVTTLQDRISVLAEAIRNLSHELHPGVLQHAGLVATLRRHCADVEQQHHIAVRFEATDHLDSLSSGTALCLFRVAQEALNNAVRHSRARTIQVRLTAAHEAVELGVADDGVGFVASQRLGGGLGLRSIDERVRLAKGTATVESRPGQGTAILVRLPRTATE